MPAHLRRSAACEHRGAWWRVAHHGASVRQIWSWLSALSSPTHPRPTPGALWTVRVTRRLASPPPPPLPLLPLPLLPSFASSPPPDESLDVDGDRTRCHRRPGRRPCGPRPRHTAGGLGWG